MNAEVHQDPFAAPEGANVQQQDLEVAWFDAPRRSSRSLPVASAAPVSSPAPPIDDPLADVWFK